MENYSDIRLLDLIRQGNNLAFTALVNRYWEKLYQHIYARLRHEEDAKDILQEIFISVWKNRDNITTDVNDTIASYLFRAARYCIIDHFGKPQTAIYNEEILSEQLSRHVSVSGHELLVSKQMEEELDEVLNRMPDRLQLPYRLSRYQHLSNREIASRLSLSEQTVKNNISITLRYLRTHFNEQNGIAGMILVTVVIIPS
jgi:RNA polymerase sigma factor (sigma-70 family)